MTECIYRHENGLKHINMINSEGFSALFVVNTPIFDNSGVAHGVEHMVFRRSSAFPKAETLFQLTSLTDAKINASTFAEKTYFHCQSQCYHTFTLAINYLLNGLFNPIFDAEDLRCEIHDGVNKGVIYQELIGIEQVNNESAKSNKNTKNNKQDDYCYGGISTSIGELSLNDLTTFHQQFYLASNITLVTANADIEKISNLISLLPNQANQSQQIKVALDENRKQSQQDTQDTQDSKCEYEGEGDKHHQKKYSHAINKLITRYHLWLKNPLNQDNDDYNEIKTSNKTLVTNTETAPVFPSSGLITPLVNLSNTLLKESINSQAINTSRKNCTIKNIGINESPNQPILPNLFTKLYQQASHELTSHRIKFNSNSACVSDQRNALWLTPITVAEQKLASITSYIISASPLFLAPRCQGFCYATQALVIEKSTYLAIYSAFNVNPSNRLKEISLSLLKLSLDINFIHMSLSLAKIKYCQLNLVESNQLMNITTANISTYLKALANDPHPKV